MLTISSVAVSPVPPQAPTVVRVQPTAPVKASDNVSAENQGVVAPVTPVGEGFRVQAGVATPSLPPVNPTGETPRVNNFNNTATPERLGDAVVVSAALAQRSTAALATSAPRNEPSFQNARDSSAEEANEARLNAEPPDRANTSSAQLSPEAPRLRGELPVEVQNPAMAAMEAQINDLLPNIWSASRAAVDVLIGEEARAAAAARSEILAGRASGNAERVNEAAENYNRTSNLPGEPSAGRNIDRLV
jgi:hypothetical protein